MTLIVAPAGFGKSVALRDFIETSRLDAVRHDVSREDSTVLAFVRGLSAALEGVAPSAPGAFPAIEARIMASSEPVAELLAWFDEHLKRTVCTIVIDDLHNAAPDPNSVALLRGLIERTAGRIRWIVATRSDAGLPVASWMGYGRMDVPIGEVELRFTAEEALAAADDAQAAAAPEEIAALRELTDGWPIALGIALRMRLHASDLRSAASGTREMIYRYLAEQVFNGLGAGERQFLLATCVFDGFDLDVAAAYGFSADMLADLRARATFLSASGAEAFRYHDLFRDFLERELERRGRTEAARTLTAAAELLARRGEAAPSLALFVRAENHAAILRAIEQTGFALFERGEGERLAAALDALPEDLRNGSAAALGLRAMLDAGRGHFDIGEARFVAAIDRATDTALRLELVHRYAIELVRHERDCIALLEPYAHETEIPDAARVPILGTLATAYVRAGRKDDARTTIARALTLLEEGSGDLSARLYQQAAFVYSLIGPRERARAYATQAIDIALARNLYDVAARGYSVLYAVLYDESDDPIAVLGVLDKLLESARKGASRQARIYGLIAMYEVETERGDESALERLERELDDGHGAALQLRNESLLPAQAMHAAWEGNFAAAYSLLAGTGGAQTSDDRRALRAAEIAFYACACGRSEDGDDALRDAREALDRCPAGSPRAVRAQTFVALAELVRGRGAVAHRHLTEAERGLSPAMRRLRALIAAVRAMYRVTLEQAEPSTVAAALERLRAEHLGGLARLLSAVPLSAGEAGTYAQLTPSEREILQLLARGASTKDVASRTGRSPQTVDTHIRSICRKLRCSGRREAVAVAVGSGWISP